MVDFHPLLQNIFPGLPNGHNDLPFKSPRLQIRVNKILPVKGRCILQSALQNLSKVLANWWLQNSHEDVKYGLGNVVNNTVVTMYGAVWVLEISLCKVCDCLATMLYT